ncbi:C-terminal binding protein [Sporosarcina sp. 179-K 8C2 HS]|uniref:C-terminal binding protein n=1 Tax=Sporosarcina sp. 179-K 8C2 HS TaxID=3142387 RepID=UPI00399FFA4E
MSQTKMIIQLDTKYPDFEQEKQIFKGLDYRLIVLNGTNSIESILHHLKTASAVMVREYPITKSMINEMEQCQVIVRYGVGVDNIDLEAARQKDIYVVNVPDYGTEEVSNHALALLLTVSRRIISRDNNVRQGNWDTGFSEKIYSFQNKTLGVLGYGRIGRRFIEKARAFGFSKVLVYDPYIKDKPHDIELCDLHELCRQSDIISLHMPLTKESFHILNKETLALLKENCILINTSRGGLIDEDILYDLLNKKEIFGAGLDVFEKEPPDVNTSLFRLSNVVVTNHMGWYSEESLQELQKKAAEEVRRVFSGSAPIHCVNVLMEVKR